MTYTQKQTAYLPTLTNFKPTRENTTPFHTSTIPYNLHLTPETSSNAMETTSMNLNESPVLYAGGRKWHFQTSDPTSLYCLPLNHSLEIEVDLFVMNTGFLIWFNDLHGNVLDAGLRLGYDSIISHSLRRVADGRLQLFLEVRRTGVLSDCDAVLNIGVYDSAVSDPNDVDTVEFSFIPKFSEVDRYYQDHVEQLFTFQEFGSNRGDTMAGNVFNGISRCSQLWRPEENDMDMDMGDSDNETDSIDDLEKINVDFVKEGYLTAANEGCGDDISNLGYLDGAYDNRYTAGFAVDVTDINRNDQQLLPVSSNIGFKRSLDQDNGDNLSVQFGYKRVRM
ncbi:hypothetical protein WICPIJ_005324 [Wickerhamomyces pijperi]|uniref:Protein LOT5 n=1 Tax=Wickerhamomyces pijperi TaxID=599730 RepID=A0A9P8TM32_WICPI|nr:hypothetical protein WICPIJ_005324 [Wickerhamomyces pijperi]